MKTKYLLPHRWKIFGWILVSICIPFGFWGAFFNSAFPFPPIEITLPWTSDEKTGLLGPQITNGHMVLDISDELVSIGCIAGLFMIGFSKQLVEDERIASIRLEALQWGVYANYFVLTICTMVVYGAGFFLVTFYNMFTLLVIFVVRFYWLLLAKPLFEARKARSPSL